MLHVRWVARKHDAPGHAFFITSNLRTPHDTSAPSQRSFQPLRVRSTSSASSSMYAGILHVSYHKSDMLNDKEYLPSPVSPVSTNVDTFKLAWVAEWYGTRRRSGKGRVAQKSVGIFQLAILHIMTQVPWESRRSIGVNVVGWCSKTIVTSRLSCNFSLLRLRRYHVLAPKMPATTPYCDSSSGTRFNT